MSQKETNNEPMNNEPMNDEPVNDEPMNNEPMELDDHTASQLQQYATELAEDYTGYLKVDCFQEVGFGVHQNCSSDIQHK